MSNINTIWVLREEHHYCIYNSLEKGVKDSQRLERGFYPERFLCRLEQHPFETITGIRIEPEQGLTKLDASFVMRGILPSSKRQYKKALRRAKQTLDKLMRRIGELHWRGYATPEAWVGILADLTAHVASAWVELSKPWQKASSVNERRCLIAQINWATEKASKALDEEKPPEKPRKEFQ